jgi:hypothetical protein
MKIPVFTKQLFGIVQSVFRTDARSRICHPEEMIETSDECCLIEKRLVQVQPRANRHFSRVKSLVRRLMMSVTH